EDGIRDFHVTGVQTCALPILGLARRGRAAVLSPTYAEHARAAAIVGHAVAEVRDFNALFDADLAIVVNPNNPDGHICARDDLLPIGRASSKEIVDLYGSSQVL